MDISVLLLCGSKPHMETLKRGLVTSGCRNVQKAKNQRDLNTMLTCGAKYDVAVIYMEEDYRARGTSFGSQEILSQDGMHRGFSH
jgi:hypothetical protein